MNQNESEGVQEPNPSEQRDRDESPRFYEIISESENSEGEDNLDDWTDHCDEFVMDFTKLSIYFNKGLIMLNLTVYRMSRSIFHFS